MSFFNSAHDYFLLRKKNGSYYKELSDAIHQYHNELCPTNFPSLVYISLKYVFGNKTSYRIINSITRKCGYFPLECRNVNKIMYHLALDESVEKILEQGLKSEESTVFLTDDSEYIVKYSGYMNWKSESLGRPLSFVLLAINTDLLCQNHKIYYNDLILHEFKVDYVPPECISVLFTVNADNSSK